MKKSAIWFVPAICVAIGILLLSTVFAVPIHVEGVSGIDKIEHAFAYFVLTFSFLLAFAKNNTSLAFTKTLSIVVFASLYGIGLEWVQYFFFEYRVFEWYDALANFIGVMLGLSIFKLFFRE